MAYLGVIMGCMFSEKTTELVRQVGLEQVLGRRALVAVPDIDTRVADTLYTHSHGTNTGIRAHRVPCGALATLDTSAVDVVGVDEAQFFADLVPAVRAFLAAGKVVWVAGLSGDFRQCAMGALLQLIPMADNVLYLRALCVLCRDKTKASFTKRLDATSTAVVEIGAADKYIAVCRKHL
jgi:thymidine kinase